jgi:putative transposase
MRRIDEQYLKTPFYGWPRMTAHLRRLGYAVNHNQPSRRAVTPHQMNRGFITKRVQRLMRIMGLQAIYPKHKTTTAAPGHTLYPYLLRDLEITRSNQVWSADITYIPIQHGFMYLVAILDWFSRYVLAWQLSNTLDGQFCLDALRQSLRRGQPDIFNTDQGVQFTALEFTTCLEAVGVHVSMDGRGRALDNIFIERLWRTIKYEEVYLRAYGAPREARYWLSRYLTHYNEKRPHSSLDYRTPAAVYYGKEELPVI